MKTAFAVIVLVALALARAEAGDIPGCCACLQGGNPVAQAAGGTNQTANVAIFCAAAIIGETQELAERCAGAGPDTALLCLGTLDNSSCRTSLTEQGILCPDAGAPVAGPLNLATLAIALGALGALVLRRHRA